MDLEEQKKLRADYNHYMAEGHKLISANEIEKSVNAFAEAARLSDLVFGSLSSDTFEAYINYGETLVLFGALQYALFEENSDDSEQMDIDETSPSNKFEQTLETAWDVIQFAKRTVERVLETVTIGDENRKWQLRMAYVLELFGKISLLHDDAKTAQDKFSQVVEIKQKFSDDYRSLSSSLWDLANAFETAGQFVDAQMKYAESWKALQKRCAELETVKNDANAANEIDQLKIRQAEIQFKISEMIRYETQFRNNTLQKNVDSEDSFDEDSDGK